MKGHINNPEIADDMSLHFKCVQSKTMRGCTLQMLEGRELSGLNTPHNIPFGQAWSD